MGWFERDKFSAEIVVDTETQEFNTFAVGGTIVGRVKLRVRDTASTRGVLLNYVVQEVYDLQSASSSMGDDNTHAPRYRQNRHKFQVLLLGSRSGHPIDIQSGEYCYPFAIPIPDGVPCSLTPSALGSGGGCCCHVCCKFTNVISVVHKLQVEVVIPYSFLDKDDVVKAIDVRSHAHYATLDQLPMRHATQNTSPMICGACCPGQWLFLGPAATTARYTIEVANPFVSLHELQRPLTFVVRGVVDCPFVVVLLQRTRVTLRGYPSRDTFTTVAHCSCVPLMPEHGSMSSSIDLHHLSAENTPPTIRGACVSVSYHLSLIPDFEVHDRNLCVDFKDKIHVEVPIEFYHRIAGTSRRRTLPQQQGPPMLPPLAPPISVMTTGQLGYGGASYSPESPPPAQPVAAIPYAPAATIANYGGTTYPSATNYNIEQGVVFSYAPPAGMESAFAPAGPVLESLGPPVWGTVVNV